MKDEDKKTARGIRDIGYDFLVIAIFLALVAMCSCKTKYIETIHYQPVEVHDTVYNTKHVHDSVTLHDSIYIHQKNDTVLVEKWHTKYKWKTSWDTMYISKEVPYVVTDTVCTVKEVPVDKIVYKQHWWQKALSWLGTIALAILVFLAFIKVKKF